MKLRSAPSEYHVVGPYQPYVLWGGAGEQDGDILRDRCIGPCEHEYVVLRLALDGTVWDGCGGSPVGRLAGQFPRTPVL